jgi:hypothetical protein
VLTLRWNVVWELIGLYSRYTMEGDLSPYHGTFSPSAGIIPRTLYSLFEKLAEDRSEFSVRCSFVELYNEELRDLNASEYIEPSSGPQPMDSKHGSTAAAAKEGGLRIYEDKSAGSGVLIQGLEETLIRNAEEGIKVLKRGSERRQIGATKCNEQSRSVALLLSSTICSPVVFAVDRTRSSRSWFTSRRRPKSEEKTCSKLGNSIWSTWQDPRTSDAVERRRDVRGRLV